MRVSKILTDLCFTRKRIKIKNTFVKFVCSFLAKMSAKHHQVCLSINGAQSVRLEKTKIMF